MFAKRFLRAACIVLILLTTTIGTLPANQQKMAAEEEPEPWGVEYEVNQWV